MGWPFVGREKEFARVSARLSAGEGLLVVGDPGVGKTRLARAGLDAAYARGARTEWIAGAAGVSGVPLSAVAHLIPEVDDDESEPTGFVRKAVRSLVAPRYGSLVIGLDDAHMVDAASAAIVHHAVVNGNASVLATTRRGKDIPEPLAALVREGRLERLDLPPLADAEVEALLTSALDGPVEGGTVAQLCSASQGNPMVVRELVRAGTETGALARRDGQWSWHGPVAAPRLTDLVESRLSRLSTDERSAIELIATGEPLPLAVIRTVIDASMLERLDRLELLDTRHSVFVQLAHPLYSEVLRATMSPLRRRAIELDLANAFVGLGHVSGGDVLRIVTWRLDGQEPNDPAHLRVAARRALGASDFELAERIARVGLTGDDHESCRHALGLALAGQGRIDEAHAILASSERWDGTEQTAELVSRAVDVFFYGSRTTSAAEAVEHVRHVIDTTEEWPQPSEPLVEAAKAGVLLLAGSVVEGQAVAQGVLDEPGATAVARLRALLVAAPAAYITGHSRDALAHAEHGLRLLERGTSGTSAVTDELVELDAEPLLRAICSVTNRYAGKIGLARAIADDGYRRALGEHSNPARGLFAAALGQVTFAEGHIAEAARWLREGVSLLRRPPALYLVWTLGYLAQSEALLGDLDAAEAALGEADEISSPTFQIFDSDVRLAGAWLAARRGDFDTAHAIALEVARSARDKGQVCNAAHAAHDAARLGAAEAVVDLLEDLEPRDDGELVAAYARHVRGLVARDAGQLLDAADTFEQLGWRLCAAEAAAEASRFLGQSGNGRGAGGGSGARAGAAAERALALMRSCGGVVTPALEGLGRLPMLTAREDEIVRLAANGLTNRAIASRLHLSVRTVDNHLHHAYEKLGITGRDELSETLKL